MKEGLLLVGDACAQLLEANDLEIVKKMRLALGKETVELKDVCTYVAFLYPDHDRYIRKIFPDEWRRIEFANADFRRGTGSAFPPSMKSSSAENSEFIFSGKYRAWLQSLTPDEAKQVQKDDEEVFNPKGPAKEPTVSEYINVWDMIGDKPEDCMAARNHRKFASLLELTHPDHGKHICYMFGQLPAVNVDKRNEMNHLQKENLIWQVIVRMKASREAFKKIDKSPKWCRINIIKFIGWLQRKGITVPGPDGPNGTYTAGQKHLILKLVESFFSPYLNVSKQDVAEYSGLVKKIKNNNNLIPHAHQAV